MNKLRIIDLLNKIANGEEVPKKIKWGVHNLEWYIYDYKALDELGKPTFFEITGGISRKLLNDEVEIIEDKKIEKIKNKNFTRNQKQIASKINEIIDYLEESK